MLSGDACTLAAQPVPQLPMAMGARLSRGDITLARHGYNEAKAAEQIEELALMRLEVVVLTHGSGIVVITRDQSTIVLTGDESQASSHRISHRQGQSLCFAGASQISHVVIPPTQRPHTALQSEPTTNTRLTLTERLTWVVGGGLW